MNADMAPTLADLPETAESRERRQELEMVARALNLDVRLPEDTDGVPEWCARDTSLLTVPWTHLPRGQTIGKPGVLDYALLGPLSASQVQCRWRYAPGDHAFICVTAEAEPYKSQRDLRRRGFPLSLS